MFKVHLFLVLLTFTCGLWCLCILVIYCYWLLGIFSQCYIERSTASFLNTSWRCVLFLEILNLVKNCNHYFNQRTTVKYSVARLKKKISAETTCFILLVLSEPVTFSLKDFVSTNRWTI